MTDIEAIIEELLDRPYRKVILGEPIEADGATLQLQKDKFGKNLTVVGKTLENYNVDIEEAQSGTVKREPDMIPAIGQNR